MIAGKQTTPQDCGVVQAFNLFLLKETCLRLLYLKDGSSIYRRKLIKAYYQNIIAGLWKCYIRLNSLIAILKRTANLV
jgi:hypothetical protein